MAEIIGRVGWRNYVSPISPLWNNLVAYYSGDSTANDSKGTKNLSLVNGATYAVSKINNGFSFDGINDYLNYTGSLGISGDFSISLWVNPSVLGGTKPCLQSYNFRSLAFGSFDLYFNGTTPMFQMCDLGGGFVNQYFSTTISTNNWYHLVISFNNTTKKCDMYVNGSKDSGSSTMTFNNCTSADLNNGIDFGLRQTGVFYNGLMDEIAIWNRTLTTAEVTELYNGGAGKQYVAPVPTIVTNGLVLNLDAGNAASYPGTGTTWTDLSGNVNNGTLINGTSYSLANGGTMVFDGINDQALINNSNSINITTSLTIEGWIKPTSIAGWIAIFYKNTNSVNGGYHLGIDPSGYLAGGLKEPYWTTVQSTTNQIQTNTWQQIAMSLDLNNKVLKLYKNGILIKTQTSFNYTLTGNTSPLSIGAQSNGGETFLGSIPICRLYNAVLTDADITSNFNATKTRFGL